jgi:hypothetical protein
LERRGFVTNPYNPCVWNKVKKGKQCTIVFYVNDCKISHVDLRVVDDTIDWMRKEYKKIFVDSSGKMKIARGKVHTYLGMQLNFTTIGVVKVSMIEYIDKVVKAWDDACKEFDEGYTVVKYCTCIPMAALDDLVKVNEDSVKLSPVTAKAFHNITAKALYAAKRSRLDIALDVAFLTSRVREPDVNDLR